MEHPQFRIFSLWSSSKFLRLLPRLPVTFIFPSIFLSIACFRRQVLGKMWPGQPAFLLFTVCRIFLSSLTLSNSFFFISHTIYPTHFLHSSPATYLKNSPVFLIYFPKCTHFSTVFNKHDWFSYLNKDPHSAVDKRSLEAEGCTADRVAC